MAQKPDKKKDAEDFYTSPDMKRHMSALIEHVDDRIAGIGERFVDFERTLNSHTEMLGELAEDMAIVKEKVTFIGNSLNKKVGRGELIALEHRVSAVEAG
ncbi:hypothetical protein A3G69_05005 [Candidatus Peribacteria bacterium RIFCSPLOWO2_12_FULL_53_10]|nr:MAG: hypothetical protein A3G69_05005 [Candidatus Peribacteria bacterium RIFCSPLOWO2_12_FULL_53_10]